MDFLVLILVYGPVIFVVASFTGGIAGALYAGREDRSLLANAAIGFVGWSAAWLMTTIHRGEAPEEISLWTGVLALACSLVIVHVLERRRTAVHPIG